MCDLEIKVSQQRFIQTSHNIAIIARYGVLISG